MLVKNRDLKLSLNDSDRLSVQEMAGLNSDERDAVNESYYDDNTYLEGRPFDGRETIVDEEAFIEAAIIQQVESMNDPQRKAYLESDEFKALVEAGVVGRRAIVRLNRAADLDRRMHLLCLQVAKENNDADWEALRRNRIKERQLLNKLYKKYGERVRRQATTSQKRLIKISPQAFNLQAPLR